MDTFSEISEAIRDGTCVVMFPRARAPGMADSGSSRRGLCDGYSASFADPAAVIRNSYQRCRGIDWG